MEFTSRLSFTNIAAQPRLARRRLARLPQFVLQLIAIGVGALALLPLLYLGLRAVNAEGALLNTLFSARTLSIMGGSLVLAIAVMGSAALIGVPLAWLTARTDLPYRRVWLALSLITMVTPTYLTALTYTTAFGPRGLLQGVLETWFGVQRLPSLYGFFGAWLVLTFCTFPYVLLPMRAAFLRAVPLLEEAAGVLGASRWRVFRAIVLPHCLPALVSGMLLAGLYSLSDFGAAAIMRYDTFTRVIYLRYTTSFNREDGAALALVLALITLLLLVAEGRIQRQARPLPLNASRAAAPLLLKRWRAPALLFCAFTVGTGVIVPFGVILHWITTKTVTRDVQYDVATLTLNTLGVSAVTAIVVGGVALLLALLTRHTASPLNRWLMRLSYFVYVLPGIVVGLALVFFATRYAAALYQTMPLLIIAYTLRFLPISIGATGGAFSQVNPHLEESARVLGSTPWGSASRVILPLSRSSILAGIALVFLATMKELPITLLLAPTGFYTLPYRIWSSYQEAIFSQMGLPGLLLMGVAALTVFLILRHEGNKTQ